MKSKSIVQERLESAKNRLEIITREVESQRMSPTDVSKRLREVGILLEGVQRFVKTDTNVKFAQAINQRLETGMNRVSGTIREIQDGGITVNSLNVNLTQMLRALDSVQEFVELEIETLG